MKSVRIDDDLYGRLKDKADVERRPIAWVLRQALESALGGASAEKQRPPETVHASASTRVPEQVVAAAGVRPARAFNPQPKGKR